MKTFDDWFMGSAYYEDATVEDEEKYRIGWEASNDCAGYADDRGKEIEALRGFAKFMDYQYPQYSEEYRMFWVIDENGNPRRLLMGG